MLGSDYAPFGSWPQVSFWEVDSFIWIVGNSEVIHFTRDSESVLLFFTRPSDDESAAAFALLHRAKTLVRGRGDVQD